MPRLLAPGPAHLLAALLIFSAAGATAQESTPTTRLVQLVLLEGFREPVDDPGAIPPNIQPALDDVSKLLPYQSFRLIDVAVAHGDKHLQAVMRGLDGEELEIRIELDDPDVLRSGRSQPTDEVQRVRVLDFGVKRVESSGEEHRSGQPTYSVQRRSLIQTSFSAEVGQTVVVGTARLEGDQALIAVFTALR